MLPVFVGRINKRRRLRHPRKDRLKDGEQRNWGPVGFTNTALLWRTQLTRLLAKIGFKRNS
jgi:hypothetical protein